MPVPLPRREIIELCRRHAVRQLHLFGSVARGAADAGSDVDMLVEFQPSGPEGAFTRYFDFKESLETLLHRPVDLLCRRRLRNPALREEIERTKELLYAA